MYVHCTWPQLSRSPCRRFRRYTIWILVCVYIHTSASYPILWQSGVSDIYLYIQVPLSYPNLCTTAPTKAALGKLWSLTTSTKLATQYVVYVYLCTYTCVLHWYKGCAFYRGYLTASYSHAAQHACIILSCCSTLMLLNTASYSHAAQHACIILSCCSTLHHTLMLLNMHASYSHAAQHACIILSCCSTCMQEATQTQRWRMAPFGSLHAAQTRA